MSDRISERAKCPFYENVIRNVKIVGVICEGLSDHLGFEVMHVLRLRNYKDLDDYTDIFCCDMYETCPYYIAMMATKYKGV